MKAKELATPAEFEHIESRVIHGLEFKATSWGCPEQYDVLRDGKQIGYARLRHGSLTVEMPDCGDELVLEHHFDDGMLGLFEDGKQRYGWLHKIALELLVRAAGSPEGT